jgi:hypothetical protein
MDPSEFPQVELVVEDVALIANGWVMMKDVLAVHPFPSVIKTV